MSSAYTDKDNLIMKHLPLVKKIISRIEFKDYAMDQDDLFSIGVIGLMDAIEKFDLSKKVPFEAYATLRIKGTVIDELRRCGKVSRNKIDKLNQYYRTKEELEKSFMRTPEEKEICMELGIDDKQLSSIHETVHYLSAVSLESTLYTNDGEGFSMLDIIEDRDSPTPEDRIMGLEMNKILQDAIKLLPERDQRILNLYYVEELSLKEISYILDISIPRVSQLHGKILLNLRSTIVDLTEVY
ncbi:MAG: FliA/WhiG family RNA polymerase sigma factor [Gudongella sp.]|nr:FliA/WhiG family RNA polymerase sigma factor [Gudongella sp.]